MRVGLAEASAAREVGLRYVVTLDGRDVTGSARWADVDAGLVCLVMWDHEGRAHFDERTDAVMTQVVRGAVTVALVEARHDDATRGTADGVDRE